MYNVQNDAGPQASSFLILDSPKPCVLSKTTNGTMPNPSHPKHNYAQGRVATIARNDPNPYYYEARYTLVQEISVQRI